MTKPGVQKPHWEPWQSTIACCTGMQWLTFWLQTFNSNKLLAVQRRQELDTGIDRFEADAVVVVGLLSNNYCAGTTVSFRTAFFGSGTSQVLAQVLQHSSGRVDIVKCNEFAIENKFDRATHLLQLPRYVE